MTMSRMTKQIAAGTVAGFLLVACAVPAQPSAPQATRAPAAAGGGTAQRASTGYHHLHLSRYRVQGCRLGVGGA